MIRVEEATRYQQCTMPWVFDRIEVVGREFTCPAAGTHLRADFERPTEEVRFSLIGTWDCEFPGGPNTSSLADYSGRVVGRAGFYGMAGARRVN